MGSSITENTEKLVSICVNPCHTSISMSSEGVKKSYFQRVYTDMRNCHCERSEAISSYYKCAENVDFHHGDTARPLAATKIQVTTEDIEIDV